MKHIDWQAYRKSYDELTAREHEAFYDRVWLHYPDQRHFDAEACKRFLETFKPHRVTEIGGWRGELAAAMLPDFGIRSWMNVEVCRGARLGTACYDPRYEAVSPHMLEADRRSLHADALIASHVIEHMRMREFLAYVDAVRPSAVYLASPLSDEGQSWDGYVGSHVMTEGWLDVECALDSRGLRFDVSLSAGDVHVFAGVYHVP